MRYSVLILGILMIGFISAQSSFCVDFDAPSAVDLSYTRSGNSISLSWNESIDIPDCSGIDYYSIYKNGVCIANVSDLNYVDSISSDASYYVVAVDLVGHESNSNVLEVSYLSGSGGGSNGVGGGGVSSSGSSGSFSGNTIVPVFLNENPEQDDLDLSDNSSEEDADEGGFNSFLTGAVTGLTSARGLVGVGLFLLVVLGAVLVVYNKKGGKKKK